MAHTPCLALAAVAALLVLLGACGGGSSEVTSAPGQSGGDRCSSRFGEAWSLPVEGEVLAVAGGPDVVYVATEPATVTAYEEADGAVRWSVPAGGEPFQMLATSEGLLARREPFGGGSDTVLLGAADGQERWHTENEADLFDAGLPGVAQYETVEWSSGLIDLRTGEEWSRPREDQWLVLDGEGALLHGSTLTLGFDPFGTAPGRDVTLPFTPKSVIDGGGDVLVLRGGAAVAGVVDGQERWRLASPVGMLRAAVPAGPEHLVLLGEPPRPTSYPATTSFDSTGPEPIAVVRYDADGATVLPGTPAGFDPYEDTVVDGRTFLLGSLEDAFVVLELQSDRVVEVGRLTNGEPVVVGCHVLANEGTEVVAHRLPDWEESARIPWSSREGTEGASSGEGTKGALVGDGVAITGPDGTLTLYR